MIDPSNRGESVPTMCGICGFTHAQPEDAQVLKNMCDIMAHRGPDGEGAYLANGIALGHRRLSLIDLEGGYQPMVRKSNHHVSELISAGQALSTNKKPNDIPVVSQNGEYAIVFNGEIYNYRDLAAVLKAEGWVLKTTSDTEVLLTGYIAWGEKCWIAFVACSPSRSGTSRSRSCSVHAISSASNLSTTPFSKSSSSSHQR